jgi:hypothetical protein
LADPTREAAMKQDDKGPSTVALDCSSFVQPRTPDEMPKLAESGDNLEHRLESSDYSGPIPLMARDNLPGFILRERAIEVARKRGYRWR